METLTLYGNIAGTFILANYEIILNILFLILFTLILIWDYKLFMKVLKERGEYSKKSFILGLINKVLIDILEAKNEEIKELEEQIDKLKNQKKTQKYYLEKKYLAFELATKFFLSKGAFKSIKRRYYLYNKKTLSSLEKIKKGEKNLKEQKK